MYFVYVTKLKHEFNLSTQFRLVAKTKTLNQRPENFDPKTLTRKQRPTSFLIDIGSEVVIEEVIKRSCPSLPNLLPFSRELGANKATVSKNSKASSVVGKGGL